eukprot:g41622.t1
MSQTPEALPLSTETDDDAKRIEESVGDKRSRQEEAETLLLIPTRKPIQRLVELDLLRGFIMILMAIDHLYNFIVYPTNYYKHRNENWDSINNHATASFLEFATRQVTHLCAPGFSFLMGTGMMLGRRVVARVKDLKLRIFWYR